jgi:hypothetical protein
MSQIDTQILKAAWFDFEEIKDIWEWIFDFENWKLSDANEVFTRLYKKISSNIISIFKYQNNC